MLRLMLRKRLACLTLLLPLVFTAGAAGAVEWETKADLRERIQIFDNFNFNDSVDADKWEWDSRLYLKVGARLSDSFRLYFQPQGIFIYTDMDSAGGDGDTEFSQVDFYQIFLEYKKDAVGLKLGRQTLVYGDQRLLGHLGWKDVSRTFDGVKLSWHGDPLKIDLFVVHPADIIAMSTAKPGSSSGESLVSWQDRWLTGAYATYNFTPSVGADLYFINWYHDDDASLAPERSVNTFGARAFLKKDRFDATGEIAWQTGDWTKTVDQSAYALAVKAGYTFDKWKTRIGVEYDFSPGDDDLSDSDHEVFVFPYHTNHMHYGEMDFFSWANMSDLRFSLKTVPSPGLIFLANVHFLELDEPTDAWLNVVGAGVVNPVFGPGSPAYKEDAAGTEVDLKVVYKVKRYKGLKLVANYSVFLAGDAVEERNNGHDDNASFVYLIAQYAF